MKDTVTIAGVEYELRRSRRTARLLHPDGRITIITGKPSLVEAQTYRGYWVYDRRTGQVAVGQPLKEGQALTLNGKVVERRP